MTDTEQQHEEVLQRIASSAAQAAAEAVVRVAEAAALQVSDTAAQTARVLAESTRIDLQYIKDDLREIKTRLQTQFVTRDVFDPIRNLVYGQVGLILIAVATGVLALVLRGD